MIKFTFCHGYLLLSNLNCLVWRLDLILMQKLKTGVVKDSINPEWNEELTLYVSYVNIPVHLVSTEWNSLYHASVMLLLARILFYQTSLILNWWWLRIVLFSSDSFRQRHFHRRRQHGRRRNRPKAVSSVCKDELERSSRWPCNQEGSTR